MEVWLTEVNIWAKIKDTLKAFMYYYWYDEVMWADTQDHKGHSQIKPVCRKIRENHRTAGHKSFHMTPDIEVNQSISAYLSNPGKPKHTKTIKR